MARAGFSALERDSRMGFRHEALLYSGPDELTELSAAFVSGAVTEGEPVLAVMERPKLERLRAALGPHASGVAFADMAEMGRNPARFTARWQAFVADHPGARRLRGIGEPIYAGRSDDELAECRLHESLLNLVFDSATPLWLLCLYDGDLQGRPEVDEALACHPSLVAATGRTPSGHYHLLDPVEPFRRPLPPPPAGADHLTFSADSLADVRAMVAGHGRRAGLDDERVVEVVLAVNEVAGNSVQHGGGTGTLSVWHTAQRVVFDVADRGRIDDPTVGQFPPAPDSDHGRGLWIANQLCDLVQVRSTAGGSSVRLHVHSA